MLIVLRFMVISVQFTRQLGRLLFGSVWCRVVPPWQTADVRRARVERLKALCFTDVFRNLGATFIKIGQILSSRPDLLPAYLINELKLLQDQVPPFEFSHFVRTFTEEFGTAPESVFDRINPVPVAAASIAQVHDAVLKSGERVAVKVRRPDIVATMRMDLAIFRFFAKLTAWMPFLSTLRLGPQVESFAAAIHAQLDLRIEAANNRRFRENFRHIPYVRFAQLHDRWCSERVMTMEFCVGKKIPEIGPNPPVDRKLLAERLFSIYIEMIYGNQFVHADMHPGNVFMDGEGNFILLDTGLVCDIPRDYVKRFIQVALAASTLNGAILVQTYLQGRNDSIDPETVRCAMKDADAISAKLQGKTFGEIEFGAIFFDIFTLLRKYRVWMEPELTMMLVSDITMEGMAKELYPKFDVLTYMQKMVPHYLPKLGGLQVPEMVSEYYKAKSGGG